MHLCPWLCFAAACFGGCALPTSPVAPSTSASRLSLGDIATLGAGTAVGAVIGDKLGGNTGALVGGATGLAAAALIRNSVTSATDSASAEAAEQARREERLKIMQDYWEDQTLAAKTESTGSLTRAPLLSYPAGTYSGVNFAPRLAPDPTLAEPAR